MLINLLSAQKAPDRLTDIATELGLSKTTAYRALSILKTAQWVTQDPDTKKFTLGPRVLELGLSMLSQLDLRTAGLPWLRQLRNTTHEASMLSARVGFERMYIEQIQSDHEVGWRVELGKRFPLWLGAPGKAILAYLEESEIEAIIDNFRKSGVQVYASGQLVDIERLRKELAEIRRQGFAVSVGERLLAVPALAAPIFDYNGKPIGAISLGGPLPRFTMEMALGYGGLVSKAAKEISSKLGYMTGV